MVPVRAAAQPNAPRRRRSTDSGRRARGSPSAGAALRSSPLVNLQELDAAAAQEQAHRSDGTPSACWTVSSTPSSLAARPMTRPQYVAESTEQPQPTHKIDRKLAVRACRVLRLQIKAFEDAFAETSKRRPRGSDRRPLASTYRQYRDWKRCIRHDAAAAIQGLCRRRRARPMVSSPRPRPPESTIAQLRLDKRNIKKKLRAYDAQFIAKHGRSPHALREGARSGASTSSTTAPRSGARKLGQR